MKLNEAGAVVLENEQEICKTFRVALSGGYRAWNARMNAQQQRAMLNLGYGLIGQLPKRGEEVEAILSANDVHTMGLAIGSLALNQGWANEVVSNYADKHGIGPDVLDAALAQVTPRDQPVVYDAWAILQRFAEAQEIGTELTSLALTKPSGR